MCTPEFIKDRLEYYENLVDELISTDTDGACLFGEAGETAIVGDLLLQVARAIVFYRLKRDRSLDIETESARVHEEMKQKIIHAMPAGPVKSALTAKYN